VKITFKGIHANNDTESGNSPNGSTSEGDNTRVLVTVFGNHLLPEHFSKLSVGKRKSPKTKVRSSVRDGTEDEFDGVNGLVDHDITEAVLLMLLNSVLTLMLMLIVVHLAGETNIIRGVITVVVGLVLIISRRVARREHLATTLSLTLLNEGLGKKHHGNAGNSNEKEDSLNNSLTFIEKVLLSNGTRRKEHINHGLNKVGSVSAEADPVSAPLDEDHGNHVTEDTEEEQDTGQELEIDGDHIVEVDMVVEGEKHTEGHLNDTNGNGHLHLEGVEELEGVLLVIPSRIHTEGINFTVPDITITFVVEVGAVDVHRNRHDIVVNDTAVNGEETHEEDDITTAENHVNHFIETLLLAGLGEALLEEDEQTTDESDNATVTNITVHDTEEEGEENDGEETRVELTILGETVGVDNSLEGLGELVAVDVGGRNDSLLGGSGVTIESGLGTRALGGTGEGVGQVLKLLNRAPTAHEDKGGMELALHESVDHDLLTEEHLLPETEGARAPRAVDLLRISQSAEDAGDGGGGLLESLLLLTDLAVETGDLLSDKSGLARGHGVDSGVDKRADLEDTLVELSTDGNDAEDDLLDVVTSVGVNEGDGALAELDNGVGTTRSAVHKTSEDRLVSDGNNTADVRGNTVALTLNRLVAHGCHEALVSVRGTSTLDIVGTSTGTSRDKLVTLSESHTKLLSTSDLGLDRALESEVGSKLNLILGSEVSSTKNDIGVTLISDLSKSTKRSLEVLNSDGDTALDHLIFEALELLLKIRNFCGTLLVGELMLGHFVRGRQINDMKHTEITKSIDGFSDKLIRNGDGDVLHLLRTSHGEIIVQGCVLQLEDMRK